ncbi:MAG: hypothetical protein RBR82_01070 [Pseudomonas sp.]|nr:hypothetical protein [Pseudomonas sp.]
MKLPTFFKLITHLSCLVLFPCAVFAQEEGASFPVYGEQLEFQPPSGWKLAWMSGAEDGPYLAEYIPEHEDIDAWREGYLSVQRFEYPPSDVLQEIKAHKTRLADIALDQYITQAQETCGGQHQAMSQRTNMFNGIYFAVGGGYCDKYGPSAPFGEGAFVAIAEGKQFFFKIQYAWRPISAAEQQRNRPWRIAPQQAKEYLESIKTISLCGGEHQPECQISYIP